MAMLYKKNGALSHHLLRRFDPKLKPKVKTMNAHTENVGCGSQTR